MNDEDKTKEQLKAANQQLQASEQQLRANNQQLQANEQQLRAEITERKKAEKGKKQLLRNLTERVKELGAFYDLSELMEKAGISLEELYQKAANIAPGSWQYPDITCARIVLDGKEYQTGNFKETRWKQSADIKIYGNKAGALEVFYLEERPKSDKGPFLKEEEKLINALAERLGKIVERKKAEEQSRASEQQLKAANQQLRASEQQLRASTQQLRANEQQLRAEITERKEAEETLRKSEMIFRTTIIGLPLAVFALNHEGLFMVSEGQGLEKLDIFPDKVLGKSVHEVFADRPIILEVIQRAFEARSSESTIKIGEFALHIQCSPILDPNGKVESVICIGIDVTERKKVEKASKKHIHELEVMYNGRLLGNTLDRKNREKSKC